MAPDVKTRVIMVLSVWVAIHAGILFVAWWKGSDAWK